MMSTKSRDEEFCKRGFKSYLRYIRVVLTLTIGRGIEGPEQSAIIMGAEIRSVNGSVSWLTQQA